MSPDLFDELKAIDLGHAEIGDENARRLGIQVAESFFYGLSRTHLRTRGVEQLCQQRKSIGVVIDCEDMHAL